MLAFRPAVLDVRTIGGGFLSLWAPRRDIRQEPLCSNMVALVRPRRKASVGRNRLVIGAFHRPCRLYHVAATFARSRSEEVV